MARRAEVPLLQPERVSAPASVEALRAFAPDLGVVVAFGQFLGRRVRELPRLGYLVNAHASLLPAWRGAAPIAHAVLAGDAETGVSVMRVEREMDAGPVCLERRTPIGPKETAGALGERLAALAADAMAEAVDAIAAGTAAWREQEHARATYAPKLSREDGRLDLAEPAAALERRVRAFAPRPGAFTELRGEPLRVLEAEVLPGPVDAPPGTACRGGDPPLRIATGEGFLAPLRVQRAGGKALPIRAFLAGRDVADGEVLGK